MKQNKQPKTIEDILETVYQSILFADGNKLVGEELHIDKMQLKDILKDVGSKEIEELLDSLEMEEDWSASLDFEYEGDREYLTYLEAGYNHCVSKLKQKLT